MIDEEIKAQGKRFHEYVQKLREEEVRKKIRHQYDLIELSIKIDDANKARIKAEMEGEWKLKNLAKEIVKDILKPAETPKKLTKKQLIEQRAREISEKNKLEIIAKASQKNK